MSLIPCRACGAEIATTARSCPQCGGRTAAAEESFLAARGYIIGTVLAVVLTAVLIYGYFLAGP